MNANKKIGSHEEEGVYRLFENPRSMAPKNSSDQNFMSLG